MVTELIIYFLALYICFYVFLFHSIFISLIILYIICLSTKDSMWKRIQTSLKSAVIITIIVDVKMPFV